MKNTGLIQFVVPVCDVGPTTITVDARLPSTQLLLNSTPNTPVYTHNVNCTWHILSPANTTPGIHFISYRIVLNTARGFICEDNKTGYIDAACTDYSFTRTHSGYPLVIDYPTTPPIDHFSWVQSFLRFQFVTSLTPASGLGSLSTALYSGVVAYAGYTCVTSTIRVTSFPFELRTNYVVGYVIGANCTWIFSSNNSSTNNTVIAFKVISFNTNPSYDFLYFRYRLSPGATPQQLRLSGLSWPGNISTTPYFPSPLVASFVSDYVSYGITYGGVRADVYLACHDNGDSISTHHLDPLLTPTVNFSTATPGYNYITQTKCSWLLTAPDGWVIALSFTAFVTEYQIDVVYVFDGADTSSPQLLVLSGNHTALLPVHATSTGPAMLVAFTSDESVEYEGFTATASLLPAPSTTSTVAVTIETTTTTTFTTTTPPMSTSTTAMLTSSTPATTTTTPTTVTSTTPTTTWTSTMLLAAYVSESSSQNQLSVGIIVTIVVVVAFVVIIVIFLFAFVIIHSRKTRGTVLPSAAVPRRSLADSATSTACPRSMSFPLSTSALQSPRSSHDNITPNIAETDLGVNTVGAGATTVSGLSVNPTVMTTCTSHRGLSTNPTSRVIDYTIIPPDVVYDAPFSSVYDNPLPDSTPGCDSLLSLDKPTSRCMYDRSMDVCGDCSHRHTAATTEQTSRWHAVFEDGLDPILEPQHDHGEGTHGYEDVEQVLSTSRNGVCLTSREGVCRGDVRGLGYDVLESRERRDTLLRGTPGYDSLEHPRSAVPCVVGYDSLQQPSTRPPGLRGTPWYDSLVQSTAVQRPACYDSLDPHNITQHHGLHGTPGYDSLEHPTSVPRADGYDSLQLPRDSTRHHVLHGTPGYDSLHHSTAVQGQPDIMRALGTVAPRFVIVDGVTPYNTLQRDVQGVDRAASHV